MIALERWSQRMNKRKCLNEACPLNKELKCDNPRQHRKDFICRGKDEIKAKNNYIRSYLVH